jgi:Fe-S cluster biogenesis protein NfuA
MPPEATGPVDRQAVEAVLAHVRPLLKGHGGDLTVTGIDNGIVTVAFRGACEACPNITMTYVGPVRTALLQVCGVREVRSPDVHAAPRALARIAKALGAAEVPV